MSRLEAGSPIGRGRPEEGTRAVNIADRGPLREVAGGETDSLSLAFICPGWPPESFANGVMTVVAKLGGELRRRGHAVTTIADRGVEDLEGDVKVIESLRQPAGLTSRTLDRIARTASWIHSPASGATAQAPTMIRSARSNTSCISPRGSRS